MEKKRENLLTLFLVIAIILIGVMGYIMYQMNFEIKQLSEKVANSENVSVNDKINENNKDVEDIASITAKCKAVFEEYYDLYVEIYSGGSLYALKKLDLVSTTPAPEQYETTTYEFDEFYKTDIKYSEFKNAMLKYITGEFLEKDIEKYYAKNVNGYLHITAMGGTATYIDIDKFQLSSNDKGEYTFDVSAEKSYDDHPSKDSIKLKVTFEKQNGNYVVSNVEDKTTEQTEEKLSNEYSIKKVIMWTPNTTSYDFNTKQWLPNNSAEYYVAKDKDNKLCIIDKEEKLVKKFDIKITDLITSAYVTEWEKTLTIIQKDATAYDINITDFTYRQYQYASGY